LYNQFEKRKKLIRFIMRDLTKNIVQFRNNFVNLKDSGENNLVLAMSVVSELMQFGYVLDQSAIDVLTKTSKEDIISFHDEVIPYLKKMTGSNRNYRPFWKGFPQEVMEKSECELWLHQIVHYISGGEYEPNEWTKERPTAFEQPSYTTITAGDEDRFLQIFTDLVSVNQSLTPDDMEIVQWFVSNEVELRFPKVIPFKENLCTLASFGLDVPVKTVTDVLRIAVGLSGGDVSLPKVPAKRIRANAWSTKKVDNPNRENFKFKKFSRKERRYILGLLEKTNCDATEAVLKDQRWVRLGEIIHPGEYKNRFPKAFKMFDKIRNEKVTSWYGKVEKAFKKSFEDGLVKLAERPGEFMRRIDWILRTEGKEKSDVIFKTLLNVAPRVSNKVLFELLQHLEKRRNLTQNRTVMVKGARSRVTLPDLNPIDNKVVTRVQGVIMDALGKKFSEMESLKSVWVDDALENIPLPSNMRSVSSSLAPVVRGQRTPIGNQNAKVIRAFVHWFDERGHEDLDLSATFVGMGKRDVMSWNGSHNRPWGCHSGDIRHRQGACAEYIDIDIEGALKEGFKYVIIDVHNFNGRSLASVKDCVAGYMEREHPEANEIFVPSTLAGSMRLQSDASTTIISVVDIETQEYIHLDIDKSGLPVTTADFNGLMEAIKPYCEKPAFSVLDLLMLHIEARGGELVDNKEDAETVFTYDDFSTSYVETLKLMGV
jgi:hypothetical protein